MNMNDPLKKLHDDLQKIRLTVEEKSDMHAELLRFMNEHPVRRGDEARLIERTRPFGWFVSFLTPRPMPALLALLIVVFTGGGVSLASNNALPGDFLYPFKVSVNEEVRSALTFSDKAKLAFEIDRSGRRLAEAAKLDARGGLKSEAAAKLAAQVEARNESIAALEVELEARGEADAVAELRSEYEARLLAYESLLYQVLSESPRFAFVAEDEDEDEDEKNEAGAAAEISVKARPLVEVRLPDLISEVHEDNRDKREDAEDEDRGEGEEKFLEEATQAVQKAKVVYSNAQQDIMAFAELEGRELFEKPFRKLEEAETSWSKATVEFEAGRYAAAFAHANASITFANQALNMARQTMADLERQRQNTQNTQGTTIMPSGIDFAITDIYLKGTILTAVQTNLGDAEYNALNGHTYIWIDDMNLPKWTYSWATLSGANLLFLNGNGSSSLQPQGLKGKHTVKVCIDALNVVGEIDENNNCLTKVVATAEERVVIDDDNEDDDEDDDDADDASLRLALDMQAQAKKQMNDARFCLDGLIRKGLSAQLALAENHYANAQARYDLGEAALANKDNDGAYAHFKASNETALLAYTLGQEVKARDKSDVDVEAEVEDDADEPREEREDERDEREGLELEDETNIDVDVDLPLGGTR